MMLVPRNHIITLSEYSYETVVKRWPIILDSLIDTVKHEINLLSSDERQNRDRIVEGKAVVKTIVALKAGMARNDTLQ